MGENNWADRDPPTILHCFADYGVESELLSELGDVYRVGIDVHDTNRSTPIQADAHVEADGKDWQFPVKDDTKFDLGVFHPVCSKWAATTSISGRAEDHENMIPSARRIAAEHCRNHVIENVPRAPLKEPTVLNGRMFGLPIEFERAFETSFRVPEPPRQGLYLTDEGESDTTETSSFYFTERSRLWWSRVKGCDAWRYPKQHLAKNAIPRVYLDYVLQSWIRAHESEETDIDENHIDYSNYDERQERDRREGQNSSLYDFDESSN